jgi:hypothetical protein
MSWDCVKDLRADFEKNSLTKVQFRSKILNAVYQMQMALGINDLGQFHYKPLKDADGTVVLCCVLNIKVSSALWSSLGYRKLTETFSAGTKVIDESPLGAAHKTPEESFVRSRGQQLNQRNSAQFHPRPSELPQSFEAKAFARVIPRLFEDVQLLRHHSNRLPSQKSNRSAKLQDPRQSTRVSRRVVSIAAERIAEGWRINVFRS